MTQLKLAIEMQPMGPAPAPTNIGVFDGEKLIGYVEVEHVREIVAKWDAMLKERQKWGG